MRFKLLFAIPLLSFFLGGCDDKTNETSSNTTRNESEIIRSNHHEDSFAKQLDKNKRQHDEDMKILMRDYKGRDK